MYKQAIRFLWPLQSQRLNYLKANWVLKWAICQWESHWFNLPCGFFLTLMHPASPLCAFRERCDRYTFPSLNLSSERVDVGCCVHVHAVVACLLHFPCFSSVHISCLIFFSGLQGKWSDRQAETENWLKENQYLDFDKEDIRLPSEGTPLFYCSRLIFACMLMINDGGCACLCVSVHSSVWIYNVCIGCANISFVVWLGSLKILFLNMFCTQMRVCPQVCVCIYDCVYVCGAGVKGVPNLGGSFTANFIVIPTY